jgi:hypothetical protein
MYSKNDFVVELNEFKELTTDMWKAIYEKVRKEKLYDSKHDYGLKVSVNKIPELQEFANKFKTKDHFWILLTNGTSNSRFYVHVDGQFDDGSPGGINWPLYNCDERSSTYWVKPLEEKYYEISYNSYTLEEDVETKEIFSYSMLDNKPVLFRSNLWHYAVNSTGDKKWRVIIKWELLSESWETLVDEFESYKK